MHVYFQFPKENSQFSPGSAGPHRNYVKHFEELLNWFSTVDKFHIPITSMTGAPPSSRSHHHQLLSIFSSFNPCGVDEVASHTALSRHSLMTDDTELLVHVLIGHLCIFFDEMSIQILYPRSP